MQLKVTNQMRYDELLKWKWEQTLALLTALTSNAFDDTYWQNLATQTETGGQRLTNKVLARESNGLEFLLKN